MIVIVILILLAVFLMNFVERRDLICPPTDVPHTSDECIDTRQAFVRSKPLPTDTKDELLDKIQLAAQSEHDNIKWRRCLIIAIVTSVGGQLLMTSACGFKNLYWKNLLVQTLVSFIITFMFLNYYSVHVFDVPLREQIPQALKMLKKM